MIKKISLIILCVFFFHCHNSNKNISNGKIRFKGYNNGEHYIGSFKRNLRDGTGTYTYSNGYKYVGEWKKDERDGAGTYIYSNGDKYVGEWKKNERDGFGISIFQNEINYAHWNNGLLNLESLTFDLDSNLINVSNYSNGQYDGIQRRYFDKYTGSLSGGFIEEIYFKDSLINPIKVYNHNLQVLFNVSVDKSGIVVSSECKDEYGNLIDCYDYKTSYFVDWFYKDPYDNEIYLDIPF